MGILMVFLQGLLQGILMVFLLLQGVPLGNGVGITTWIPKMITNGNLHGIPQGNPNGYPCRNLCEDS